MRGASEKAEKSGKETLTDVTEAETGTQKTGKRKECGNGIGSGIVHETDQEVTETAGSREKM